jgi:hypothetical protein
MRKLYFFLPPHLCPAAVKLALAGYRDKAKVANQACLLYHKLCIDLIKQRESNIIDGFTQVHHTMLIKMFDDEYKKPVRLLIEAGLLEMNIVDEATGECYEEGAYSKAKKVARSFRIPRHLLSDGKLFTKKLVDKTDKVLMNKISAIRQLTKSQEKAIEDYRLYVLRQMNEVVLLDNPHSRGIIKCHLAKQGIPCSDAFITAKIDFFNNNPIKRHEICLFGSRLHTEITNNLKALRVDFRFPQYLDSRIAEIDLVASQPWFLSIITPALINRFVPECRDAIPIFKRYSCHEHWLKFQKLCASVDYGIYHFLADKYNELYSESFTRDDAKRICYRAFYSNYARHEKLTLEKCQSLVEIAHAHLAECERESEYVWAVSGSPSESIEAEKAVMTAKKRLKLAASQLFTHKCITVLKESLRGVYELLDEVKRLRWDFERGSKFKSVKYYANPALLAQRLEANIVYTVIVKALVENGITNIITIHDSFGVREEVEVKARRVIIRAFKCLGLSPSLKNSPKASSMVAKHALGRHDHTPSSGL